MFFPVAIKINLHLIISLFCNKNVFDMFFVSIANKNIDKNNKTERFQTY